MTEEITLNMSFDTTSGKKRSLKVYDAKSDLDQEQVKETMETIISCNVFGGDAGELTASNEAYLLRTERTDFNVKDQP